MEEYYVAFKEKRSIHEESQFDVNSFKNAFPDIHDQNGMRDWGPFTILVDLYFLELGLEVPITLEAINLIYLVYPIQSQSIFCKKFEARMWLDLVCSRLMPSQNTTKVPIKVAILVACIMDHVHINVGGAHCQSIQTKNQAASQGIAISQPHEYVMCAGCMPFVPPIGQDYTTGIVITLATKTDKVAPAMKRSKCTTRKTPPPPSASSTTSTAQFHPAFDPAPTPPYLLKIAQRAQVHESELVKLAKAILFVIQTAIKKSHATC
ncbi:hypothetical protein HAX54_034411 [Datura stramonium]|uniref:Uncharacterized protein n=1 Tax=Datura stramonium TaxID=4076 RepID=A0ABS8VE14_DATST|nr:hypothetical protein [Datura stramonium]